MKILIVGSGGREHALAWKVAQSPKVSSVYVAPGNAGTKLESKVSNADIAVTDIPGLAKFAQQNEIHLTIIGPEIPLVLGIVDTFNSLGLRCFGPSKAAAQLEGSKEFAKDFFVRHQITTAKYQAFSEVTLAIEYLKTCSMPIVIKADGLAAGKGVIIAQNLTTAKDTVKAILTRNKFGVAGNKLVIEEFLTGEEASFIVMSDGKNVLPMATSQDHKARDNGDNGPNTGGMGAYSPAPIIDRVLHEKIMQQIIMPCINGMRKDGNPFVGFLYAGLMISPDIEKTINILEVNVRLGDPETQPILMRLQSDLVELCDGALDQNLDKLKIKWDEKVALTVVMAAGGYPDSYQSGEPIKNIPKETKDYKTFHAGTKTSNGQIVTAGGRVLNVCALGSSVLEAQTKAYQNVSQIKFNHAYYRNDIGFKAIK